MNPFIPNAYAAAPAQAGVTGGGLLGFLPLILIFIVFYFLLIRPQSKRAKEHRAMVAALAKGDEVVTNGGVLGRVTEVGEAFVTVEIAEGVSVRVQRQAVASLMPKGTVKST
ncbi:MAG: preprotein translocase subunit YajC [Acidiferrobacterales bacterium]